MAVGGLVIATREHAAAEARRLEAQRRAFVEADPALGHYRPERAALRQSELDRRGDPWQQRVLRFLRDNVDPRIPRAYYRALLGHDLHLSVFAELTFRHWHASWVDPFDRTRLGWWEDVGLASCGKVTAALRDYEIDNLVALDTTGDTYGTFKYHEVGLSTQAEANTDTALISSSGIARAVGTQVEQAADQYRSVGTVTADAAETWEEHGLFNSTSGPVLADRSRLSPNAVVQISDQVAFTYTMTKNAEA